MALARLQGESDTIQLIQISMNSVTTTTKSTTNEITVICALLICVVSCHVKAV